MQTKFLTLSVLCAGLFLTGCNESPKSTQSSNAASAASTTTAPANDTTQVKSTLPADAKTYTMAVDATYPPFAFEDDKGNIIGFDIDLIKAIGEQQGFRVQPLANAWDGIFTTLDNGTRDIVGSSVAITPERQQKMDFSTPYMESYFAIAYKDPTITSLDSLKTKKVGVQAGASYIPIIKSIVTSPDGVQEFKTTYLAYQALLTGKVDGVADDINILNYETKQLATKTDTSQVKTLEIPNTEKKIIAFAIKKGRTDLAQQLNSGLDKIKADGTYDKIYSKWFGKAPTATVTALASTASASK